MSHKLQHTPPLHDQPDAWHRHIPEEEGEPQEEHGGSTRPIALGLAFIICFGFVVGTILASYLYFEVYMTSLRRSKIETTAFAQDFAESKSAELGKLTDYYFPTDDMARKGQAAMPVEEAKKRIIARYARSAGPK